MQVAALFMIAKKLTQRLINWYMDKERMAYLYTRLQLSNKKEQGTDRLNIDESTYNNTVILNEKKTDIKKTHIIWFYFNDILENAEL